MQHCPMDLRTDIQQVDFWFVPMEVDLNFPNDNEGLSNVLPENS